MKPLATEPTPMPLRNPRLEKPPLSSGPFDMIAFPMPRAEDISARTNSVKLTSDFYGARGTKRKHFFGARRVTAFKSFGQNHSEQVRSTSFPRHGFLLIKTGRWSEILCHKSLIIKGLILHPPLCFVRFCPVLPDEIFLSPSPAAHDIKERVPARCPAARPCCRN